MIPIPKPGSKLIPMFSVKLKKFRTLNHFLRHEENILFSYKWTNVSCVACVTTTSDTRILTVKKQ